MSTLSDIKTAIEAIPAEIEQLIESVLDADWAAAKPILVQLVSAEEANLVQNAGNPTALFANATIIATAALPQLAAAGIKATGVTVFNWVIAAINGNLAVQTATVLLAAPPAAPAAPAAAS